MRAKIKFLKRFFKSIISFCFLGLPFIGHAQISKALENAGNKTGIRKPYEHIYVNKQTDEKGNVIKYDSVYSYTSSFHSGEAVSKALYGFNRNWLNMYQAKPSSVHGALPGTSNWTFDQLHVDMVRSMQEMRQAMIRALNAPFFLPMENKSQSKSSLKKASIPKKGAQLKTT